MSDMISRIEFATAFRALMPGCDRAEAFASAIESGKTVADAQAIAMKYPAAPAATAPKANGAHRETPRYATEAEKDARRKELAMGMQAHNLRYKNREH